MFSDPARRQPFGRDVRPFGVASLEKSPHELHIASMPPAAKTPVMNRTETAAPRRRSSRHSRGGRTAMSELTGIALALNQDGGLEVVATGRKGEGESAIWHRKHSEGGWSDWTELGQPNGGVLAAAGPAVARNADGRLEMAAIGNDLAVWHAWQRQPGHYWTTWRSLELPGGKEVISRPMGARQPDPTPTLAGNADRLLEIFAVRNDFTVWHRKQRLQGDWSDWATLTQPGEGTLGPLAIAANADGRLELFANDSEGTVWHCWQREPGRDWSGWHSLETPDGHSVRSGLAATKNQDGRLEVFAISQDGGEVWHRWQREPGRDWSRWHPLDSQGSGFSGVAVAANNAGCLELLATELNSSNGVWQRRQYTPGGDWSPWDSLSRLVIDEAFPNSGPVVDPTLALNENRRLELCLRISGMGGTYQLNQSAGGGSGPVWGSSSVDDGPS
jgi:hypothetical protein